MYFLRAPEIPAEDWQVSGKRCVTRYPEAPSDEDGKSTESDLYSASATSAESRQLRQAIPTRCV